MQLGIAVTILPGAALRATIQAAWDLAVALRDQGPLAEEAFAEWFHPTEITPQGCALRPMQ